MIEADVTRTKRISAPPLAPAEPAIDHAHLARMTLGDAHLEAEVLALFDRQATLILARMAGATPAAIAAFAHTLKGSARGIGTWRVATAAETVERAARDGARAALAEAVCELAAAVREVQAAIGELAAAR
jgi:HPt (histidine-containing phosphotransfer) domain-containing protein